MGNSDHFVTQGIYCGLLPMKDLECFDGLYAVTWLATSRTRGSYRLRESIRLERNVRLFSPHLSIRAGYRRRISILNKKYRYFFRCMPENMFYIFSVFHRLNVCVCVQFKIHILKIIFNIFCTSLYIFCIFVYLALLIIILIYQIYGFVILIKSNFFHIFIILN